MSGAPPLILCHGGPGLWDMFGGWETLLGGRVTAVRWDQRGCGRSELRGPYSVARSVADLDAVRRHLGVERVAVLGHSWGAQLALRYALDYPDRVSRLVYGSGVGLGWDWHEPFARNLTARLGTAAERVAQLREVIRREGPEYRDEARDRELAVLQWSAEFADPAAGARFAERMATPWFGINWECSASINAELKATWREPELIAACHSLRVPVLILEGADDIRPRWAVDSLEEALPLVTRVTIQGAGHLPWLEAPEEFLTALLGFLTE
jgi:proline iminopeptidase